MHPVMTLAAMRVVSVFESMGGYLVRVCGVC